MKTLKLTLLVMVAVMVNACDEASEVTSFPPKTITSLIGDKDGFGMGLAEGAAWHIEAGTALPIDHRLNDPYFTDIYPANPLSYPPQPTFEYTHTYDLEGREITAARFRFMTLGIQDGDHQVVGSETDLKLYLNDMELPGAFDSIDQFDMINGEWSGIVGSFAIEVPEALLSTLSGGSVLIRWEILQLDPNSQSLDAFAIDYSELEIELE